MSLPHLILALASAIGFERDFFTPSSCKNALSVASSISFATVTALLRAAAASRRKMHYSLTVAGDMAVRTGSKRKMGWKERRGITAKRSLMRETRKLPSSFLSFFSSLSLSLSLSYFTSSPFCSAPDSYCYFFSVMCFAIYLSSSFFFSSSPSSFRLSTPSSLVSHEGHFERSSGRRTRRRR